MRFFIITLVALISLQSCMKPELNDTQVLEMAVKGWSSDVADIESSTSKGVSTGKNDPTTGHDNGTWGTHKVTITVYGEADVINTVTLPNGQVKDIYEALIYEGTPDTESFVVLGSLTYQFDVHPDGTETLAGHINYNNAEGQFTGEEMIHPTTNWEIIKK